MNMIHLFLRFKYNTSTEDAVGKKGGEGGEGQNNDVITTTRRNSLSACQAILLGVNGISVVLQYSSSL